MAKQKNQVESTTNGVEIMENFEFPAKGTFGQAKYNWDEIFDGQCRKLVEGQYYTSKTAGFALRIKTQAKARGVNVKIAKVDGGLMVQAI